MIRCVSKGIDNGDVCCELLIEGTERDIRAEACTIIVGLMESDVDVFSVFTLAVKKYLGTDTGHL